MSDPALNKDMILEIFSYCPTSAVEKFKFLNKDYYKCMSESSFINLNLLRTNSIVGFFFQYQGSISFSNSGLVLSGDGEVSFDFLPIKYKLKIEACDPTHGIFLCVDYPYYGKTSYIICKPTTRQYQTIPTPESGYSTVYLNLRTIVSGLIVIRTNPLRYKIVKITKHSNKFTSICEMFDSDLFAWKQLDDVKLPEGESLPFNDVPVSNGRFLHWLTSSKKNVFRFCMKTETWSLLSLPKYLPNFFSRRLAKHEGKICIIVWKEKTEDIKGTWVLYSTFGKSSVNVKEEKIILEEDKFVKPVWFPGSSDVVVMAGFDWVGLYDMKSNSLKSEHFKITLPYLFKRTNSAVTYYPFYSDYGRVDFNEDVTEKFTDKDE